MHKHSETIIESNLFTFCCRIQKEHATFWWAGWFVGVRFAITGLSQSHVKQFVSPKYLSAAEPSNAYFMAI